MLNEKHFISKAWLLCILIVLPILSESIPLVSGQTVDIEVVAVFANPKGKVKRGTQISTQISIKNNGPYHCSVQYFIKAVGPKTYNIYPGEIPVTIDSGQTWNSPLMIWDTTHADLGSYVIRGEAWPLTYPENSPNNNVRDDGTVIIGTSDGGIIAPVDKLGLLMPYVGPPSIIAASIVAIAIYIKRVKRRKEKQ